MKRYGLIGSGHRAQMYTDAIGGAHADVATLVAFADTNPGRMEFHRDRMVTEYGYAPDAITLYPHTDVETMITEQQLDRVIITSPDYTHAEMIVRCLEAGVDVVVEKPLTIDAASAQRIVKAVEETGHQVVVTFNYRYSPRNSSLKEIIQSGRIGTVLSVTFEWVLDTAHGADYFRRWHREKKNSGGLLIHKASHHFDLVNWWIDDVPARVFASGGVRFYGQAAEKRGVTGRPERGTHDGEHDAFELDLRDDPRLKALYLDNEHFDGYLRDQDVFKPGVTTEDNLAVIVDYEGGPTLSYSLNAHSPWEGYRVSVNGTLGRAELEVIERARVGIGEDGKVIVDPSAMADKVGARDKGEKLTVQLHFEGTDEVEIPKGTGGHGGGDALLLSDVFNGPGEDPLGRPSDYVDGLRAISVGICGNESIATGKAIRPSDLGLDLSR